MANDFLKDEFIPVKMIKFEQRIYSDLSNISILKQLLMIGNTEGVVSIINLKDTDKVPIAIDTLTSAPITSVGSIVLDKNVVICTSSKKSSLISFGLFNL